jgi:hypothetical protein
MVKNLIGGNKAKALSNKKHNIVKIKLFKPPTEYEYIGKIIKELGSARFLIESFIDKKLTKINCSVSRSIRVKIDDFILLTILRENKISKNLEGEIVHKYGPENIDDLIKYDEPFAKKDKRINIVKLLNKGADDLFKDEIILDTNDTFNSEDLFANIDINDI